MPPSHLGRGYNASPRFLFQTPTFKALASPLNLRQQHRSSRSREQAKAVMTGEQAVDILHVTILVGFFFTGGFTLGVFEAPAVEMFPVPVALVSEPFLASTS